jgi:hypothetical protein
MKLMDSSDASVKQIFDMLLAEANSEFAKFVKNNYANWFNPQHQDKHYFPPHCSAIKFSQLSIQGKSVLMILIDNLRYDQWKAIEPLLTSTWRVEPDETYYSILPTATQYARNAIFSGLMPLQIQKNYPNMWVFDEEDEGKNMFEQELLNAQLQRLGKKLQNILRKE